MVLKQRIKVGFIALGLFTVIIFIWLFYSMIREGFDLSRKPLPEYSNLFTKEARSKFPAPYTYKSKIKEPQINYNLDNNFHLTIYRVILVNNKQPLKSLVNLQNERSERSFDAVSSYADDAYLEMTGSAEKIGPISTINFKYQGDSIKTIAKNDSLECYYLKFNTFSILYDKDSVNHIWGQAKKSNAAIDIAFIRKKKYAYVILLFRMSEENRGFQPDLLYNMLEK
jgi:hypothetical protein